MPKDIQPKDIAITIGEKPLRVQSYLGKTGAETCDYEKAKATIKTMPMARRAYV